LAPIARFTVTPGAREPGQSFAVDASASSDSEDSLGALSFAWDFETNGSFDASGTTSSHSYAAAGIYSITLRVTDTSGASATLRKLVAVAPPGGLVLVNTNSTTLTAGATPAMPGPDGLLSLREAIAYVDGTAGRQVILVQQGLSIPLTVPINLSDTAGDFLVGYGATINGGTLGASAPCMEARSPGALVAGLAFNACPTRGVEVYANDVTVANCSVNATNAGFFVNGSLSGVTLGPGNDVSNVTGYGIHLSGPALVTGNRVPTLAARTCSS
jgi:PKD repeat protein